MNWAAAHKINNQTLRIGAAQEVKIITLIRVLRGKLKNSPLDVALLLAMLQEELDKIAIEQKKALDSVLDLAYAYARNATLSKINKPTVPSLAIGYTTRWCQDGKDYQQRINSNISKVKSSIAGLLLGWNGEDPLVLMGLIYDELQKVENEWLRLIRTELEACYSQGARDAYLMKGAYYARIENDSPCDEICAEMVGDHVVDLHGGLGIALPPYHPNCKCVFLGIFGQIRTKNHR